MERVQFPHILIYDSSAGSGKTHQLALRYLHLLLFSQEHVKHNIKNILAITFTNKSSQEMRSRIIEWMKRILLDLNINDKVNKKIISELREEITLNQKQYQVISLTDSEIKSKINRIIHYLLKNYSDFKVSTIDSFVTLVLKASAFKLGIAPDFEIALNVEPYIDAIIDKIFQDILERPEVKKIFDKFIENYFFIRGQKINWFPKEFIKSSIKKIWEQIKQTRKNINYNQEEMQAFDKNKRDIELNLKGRLKNFCSALQKEVPEKNIDFNKRFLKKIQEFIDKGDISIFSKDMQKALTDNLNKNSAEPSGELSEEWENIKHRISQYYTNFAEYYYFYLLEIFQLFERKILTDIRYKGNTIFIQELNNLLRDILKRAEDDPAFLPELYYYLSSRYYHFLIDEFQDTNYLQWQNLSVLIEESLSSGGSLFIVGDRKQAIYNWRGASSDLISQVDGMFHIENIYRNTLNINFRSKPSLIWFFNRIFNADNIISNFVSSNKYFDDENKNKVFNDFQNSTQNQVASSNKEKNPNEGYIYIKKIVHKDLVKEEVQKKIKNEFLQIIEGIRSRKIYQDKDICVLCRKREQVDTVVNWLLEKKINVEADITVDIRNNPLIKEIISLIHFLNEPENNFALINFLSGDIFLNIFNKKKKNSEKNGSRGSLSSTNYTDNSSILKKRITEWFQQHLIIDSKESSSPGVRPKTRKIKFSKGEEIILYKKFKEAYPEIWNEYFDYFFKVIGYLPPYEFALLMLKKWEVLKNFNDFSPYFLKLLEIIKHIENQGDNSIHSLLDYFTGEKGTDELFLLNTGEGINAVKVMTVHKSKGLEFPVVILPFANLKSGKNDNMFFIEDEDYLKIYYIIQEYTQFSRRLDNIYSSTRSRELIEELNNLYVSFTRAKDELYIILPESSRISNNVINLIYNHNDIKKFITGDVIQIGVPGKTKKEKEEEREQESLDFEDFQEGLRWFDLIKTKVIRPEEITKNRFYAIQKGNIIHYILSLVYQYPDESFNLKIQQALGKFNLYPYGQPGGDKDMAEDIAELLEMNFKNEEFSKFFKLNPEDLVYNEKEIVDSRGSLKRVDRFIIRKEKIEVVDFKTGEEYKEEHHYQITEYMKLLKDLYPDKRLEGYLCYLDEKKVSSMTFDISC